MTRRVFHRRRRARGQAITESVLVLMILLMVFYGLLQIAFLGMNQIIIDHTAYVTARSYIVGFDQVFVRKAARVGSIGMIGPLFAPQEYAGMSPEALGGKDEELIVDYLSHRVPTMEYLFWDNLQVNLPSLNTEGIATIGIHFAVDRDYVPPTSSQPGEDDQRIAKNPAKNLDLSPWVPIKRIVYDGQAEMLNQSGFYLQ